MKSKVLEERLAHCEPSWHGGNRCIVWYNPNTAEIYGIAQNKPNDTPLDVKARYVILDYDTAHSCPLARLAETDPEMIRVGREIGMRVYSPVIGSTNSKHLKPGLKRVLKQIAEFRIKKGYDPDPKKRPEQAELKF